MLETISLDENFFSQIFSWLRLYQFISHLRLNNMIIFDHLCFLYPQKLLTAKPYYL